MKKVLLSPCYLFMLCFFLLVSESVSAGISTGKSFLNLSLMITAPSNLKVSTDLYSNVATNVFLGTPVITNDFSIISITNNAPVIYPIGTTTVMWTVIDNAGYTASATQTVTVTDNEKPFIGRLGEISVVNEPGKCGATVALFTPYAYDNSGVVTLTNDAPSFFNVGSVIITWTATDMYGNSDTSTQMITVIDNELPSITIGNIFTANDIGSCGAKVNLGTPLTYDNCGIASVSNDAPSFFPVGTTIVTWTVKDIHAYTVTTIQAITVTDIQKPTIIPPPNKTITLSKGASFAANVNLGTSITADNCGVKSVTNNAPVSYPVGITTVTWTVTDQNGNYSTAKQTVTVKAYTNSRKSSSVANDNSYSSFEKAVNPRKEGNELKITVSPNPTTTYFSLKLESKYDMPVNLIVFDEMGLITDIRSKLAANSTIQFGYNYHSGIYFAEMIQGTERKVVQLIKLK